jgi:hypothetical protein
MPFPTIREAVRQISEGRIIAQSEEENRAIGEYGDDGPDDFAVGDGSPRFLADDGPLPRPTERGIIHHKHEILHKMQKADRLCLVLGK